MKLVKENFCSAGWRKILFALLVSLLGLSISHAQLVAFPGAQGFGRYATGGRGGTVYHVTTLADDGSAGTFRTAVSSPNRIIVFDVGGYINLNSAVSAASNLTIAGQTAPGGGIGLMGNELSFYNQNNIICRHLRVRQGGSSSGSSGINIGSSGGQANNMIFDHTSVEFGQWDSIDAVGTYNFTIQNCIIADPINQQFGAHVQGANAAYVNNLWVNAHNRQPLAKASTVYVNNVCYDYQAGYTTADTAGHFSHDIVNNYFITGPSTTSPNGDFFQFDGNQTVYGVGNMLDSSRDGVLNGSPSEPGSDIVSATPWSPVTATIPTVPAQNAYRIDVSSAGPFPSDPLDAQVISQVMSLGTTGRIMVSPADTGLPNGGYGTIDGGTPLTETDGDGIPDIWKNAVGLNLYTNQAMVIATNGYANIENYLNWLAAPHAFVQTNATIIDLWPYTLGFTNGATYTLSGAVNGSVTLTNSHFAYFMPKPGFTGLASFIFAVGNPDGSTMTNTMGLLVSITYIPKNLVWRGNGVNNNWDTTNTADWFNGNDLVTFNSSDNVIFDDTGSTSPAININSTVAPGSVVFNNSSNNYTIGGSGTISGPASLTTAGTGTLTINNANNLTGNVNLNNGTIQLNNGGTIGTGAIIFQGGTLVNNWAAGNQPGFSNPIIVTNNSSGTIYLGSRIALSGAISGNGTLNINAASTAARDDLDGNYGAFTGTVNLLGSGQMRGRANGGYFTGFGGASVVMNTPVSLGFYDGSSGNTFYFGALSGTNPATVLYLSYAGAPTLNIGSLNLGSTFAGQFQNSINLVKVGTGTLTLSGVSTHTGTTTVSNGTLLVTGSFSNSPVTVTGVGTLRGTGFLGGGVNIQAGGSVLPGIVNGQAGTLTISNGLTLSAPNLFFDLSSSPSGGNDKILMQGGSLALSGVNNYIFYPINGFYGAGTYDLIDGATNSTAWSGVTTNLPANTRQIFNLFRASNGSNPSYVRLTVTGNAGSLVWQGTNGSNWDIVTTNWLNGASADQFYNLDSVTFNDTSTNGAVMVSPYTTTVQPGFLIVSNNTLNYTLGGGGLAGQTAVVKNGSGMLTLSPYMVSTTTSLVNGSTTVTVASTNGIAPGQTVNGPHVPGGTTVVSLLNSTNVILSQPADISSTYTFGFCAVNSFSGGMVVNSGTLQLVNNPYGGGTGPIVLNGATLFLNGIGTGTTITCTGTNTLQTYGQPDTGFGLTGAGVLNLNIGGGGVFSPSGDWSGFSGTLNFLTGNWIRELNTVSFGSSNAVWNFGPSGGFYNKYGGSTIYLGAVFGGASAGLAGATTAYASLTTFAIGGVNTNSVFNGTISDGGAAATALIFNGPGSLALSGNNTFSGGTTVNGGTLFVNSPTGSGTGSGSLSINPGATLGGDGMIGGQVSFAAETTLAPGYNGAGTLTITNDLGLNNATVLQFDLGMVSDQVAVTGDLTLGGILSISAATGFGPGTYTLFTYGGTLSVGTITLGTAPSGYGYTIDTSVQGAVNLIVSLPQFGNIIATPNGMVMGGSGGPANGNYYLLSSSNLALPLANWPRVATNQFDATGSFTFTNALNPNSGQWFYRLQLP
jgi:autotransporter-associated beta strand protein